MTAKREGLRLWSGAILVMGKRHGFRLVHAVVSLRVSSSDDLTDLKYARLQVRRICKAHGISGGLTIYHPFRQDDENQYIPDGNIHFHIIGLAEGNILPATEGMDYVFKVIRDAKRKDYRGFKRCREIKACIFYLLTHAGIINGRHAITWFGKLSYNMLNTQTLEASFPEMFRDRERHEIICMACGSNSTERLPYYITRDDEGWLKVVRTNFDDP